MSKLAVSYKKEILLLEQKVLALEVMLHEAFDEGYTSHICPIDEAWINSKTKEAVDD